MSSPEKDIELSPVKTDPNPIKSHGGVMDKLKVAADDEEEVVIGRFRKISSAKSMAATNGNIQYPSDIPPRSDDMEAGLQMRKEPCERDKLLENSMEVKNQVTKSSFRDIEKPSRFKDQPSTTRFQVRQTFNMA